MSTWTWAYDPDGYGDSLPPDVQAAVERLGADLAELNSMVYLDGAAYQGLSPGLRFESGKTATGREFTINYATHVRGECVVIISVIVY